MTAPHLPMDEFRTDADNLRELGQQGIFWGRQGERGVKVGEAVDYYNSNGDKKYGKVTKVTSSGLTIDGHTMKWRQDSTDANIRMLEHDISCLEAAKLRTPTRRAALDSEISAKRFEIGQYRARMDARPRHELAYLEDSVRVVKRQIASGELKGRDKEEALEEIKGWEKELAEARRSGAFDMTERDWQGIEEFIKEEKAEGEHREDAGEQIWEVTVVKGSERKVIKISSVGADRAEEAAEKKAGPGWKATYSYVPGRKTGPVGKVRGDASSDPTKEATLKLKLKELYRCKNRNEVCSSLGRVPTGRDVAQIEDQISTLKRNSDPMRKDADGSREDAGSESSFNMGYSWYQSGESFSELKVKLKKIGMSDSDAFNAVKGYYAAKEEKSRGDSREDAADPELQKQLDIYFKGIAGKGLSPELIGAGAQAIVDVFNKKNRKDAERSWNCRSEGDQWRVWFEGDEPISARVFIIDKKDASTQAEAIAEAKKQRRATGRGDSAAPASRYDSVQAALDAVAESIHLLGKNVAKFDASERRVKPVSLGQGEWLATLVEGGETVWEGSVFKSQSEAERSAREQLSRTRKDAAKFDAKGGVYGFGKGQKVKVKSGRYAGKTATITDLRPNKEYTAVVEGATGNMIFSEDELEA